MQVTTLTLYNWRSKTQSIIYFTGPSYAIDTACSSSLLAMDQALHNIRSGHCDAAIEGGSNLCLKPATSLLFQKLGMLSKEGTCRSFDASGKFIAFQDPVKLFA